MVRKNTRIPYGFDPALAHVGDDPWLKLQTINEYLEDCAVVPPDLAAWLGTAIRHADGDAGRLVEGLGLKRRKGQIARYDRMKWGARIWELIECEGFKKEKALSTVAEEMVNHDIEPPNRKALQEMLNDYSKARSQAINPAT